MANSNSLGYLTKDNEYSNVNVVQTISRPRLISAFTINATNAVISNLTVDTLEIRNQSDNTNTVSNFTNMSVSNDATIGNQIILSGSSDQIIFRNVTTGANISLNAEPTSQGTVYTVPDIGMNANFVLTQGVQTINGIKVFTSSPQMPGLSIPTIALIGLANQLVLGSGNTITVNSVMPSSSRVYTIPDTGANSSFVMTDGDQTINGTKIFTSAPIVPSLNLGSITLSNTSNQITLGGGANNIILSGPTPGGVRTYTVPEKAPRQHLSSRQVPSRSRSRRRHPRAINSYSAAGGVPT